MVIQRLLAFLDKVVSSVFMLEAFGTGDDSGLHEWIYFVDIGRRIGIVGPDHEVHTIMGFWSVKHYYDGKRLVRRALLRKDLKSGERLATQQEIRDEQSRMIKKFSGSAGSFDSY